MRPLGCPSSEGSRRGPRSDPERLSYRFLLRKIAPCVGLGVIVVGCAHILVVSPPHAVPPRTVQIPLSVRVELPELSNQSHYTAEGDLDKDSVRRALIAYTKQRGTFRQVVDGLADVVLNFNVTYSFYGEGLDLVLFIGLDAYITGGGLHLSRFAGSGTQVVASGTTSTVEMNQAAASLVLRQALDLVFKEMEANHGVLVEAVRSRLKPEVGEVMKAAAVDATVSAVPVEPRASVTASPRPTPAVKAAGPQAPAERQEPTVASPVAGASQTTSVPSVPAPGPGLSVVPAQSSPVPATRPEGISASPAVAASLAPAPSLAPADLNKSASKESDVDRVPSTQVKLKPDAYALVIGVEQYAGAVPRAEFASADAALVHEYLTAVLGYPEDHVLTLLNEKATRADLVHAIERWLPERAKKGSTVLVYFAGHGTAHPKTREAYLLPADGTPQRVGKSGYALKRLYQRLSALPAREAMVVLDACFSGVGERSAVAERRAPGVLVIDPSVEKGRVVVLAAGRGAQGCNAYREQRHGLFTYFFLKGLRGEADKNQDGTIRLAEQFEYVERQVQEVAKRELHAEQVPQLLGNPKVLAKGLSLLEPAKP